MLLSQETDNGCGFSQMIEAIGEGREINRPFYSNELSNVFNDHFVIHYTTNGSCTSYDALGTPHLEPDCSITTEIAQQALLIAENVYQIYVNQGWIMPPPDGYPNGDNRLDIYFSNVPDGRAVPESEYDDPYIIGMTSFIEIAFNFSGSNLLGLDDDELLEILICHELHHSIQMRYHGVFNGDPIFNYENFWAYESSSTFIEDTVNDNINSLYFRLANNSLTPLNATYLPIDHYETRYTTALWWNFLTEYYDNADIIRIFWEWWGNNPLNYAIEGVDNIITAYLSSDIEVEYENYAIWRYFTGERSNPDLYFDEGDNYPTSSILYTHESYPAYGNNVENNSINGGTSFVEFINPSQQFDIPIFFDGTDYSFLNNCNWSVDLICFNEGQDPSIWSMELNQFSQGTYDNLINCDKVAMLSTSREYTHTLGLGFYCNYEYLADENLTQISFSNSVESNNSYGELTLDDNQIIPSGFSTFLLLNSNHEVRTNNGLFENILGSGENYKHHNWNDLETIEHHYLVESFQVENIGEQLDRFHILTEDPEFEIPTGEYNVFLNQNETFNGTFPIYSISTPPFYVSGDEAYFFSNWSASDIDINNLLDADFNNNLSNITY